jgi:23S rRNA (cytosine1962-C5)-methyltransferase
MQDHVKIILKSGKDQSLKRFHPWVFSGAIKKMHGAPAEGDMVDVYSNKDEFLGRGHYQKSSIAVRIVSFEEVEPGHDFWKDKIKAALAYRKSTGFFNKKETNVYRLVYAEGDGLPGLIVDYYNGTAVIQCHSVGMYQQRENLSKALQETLGEDLHCIYDKSHKSLPFKADIQPENNYMLGSPRTDIVSEYGNRFKVDWEGGQKTGFFIDQRENRALVGKHSRGKSVLNMFGYTGGFSVYALQGGAKLVHSVDASKKATALCQENIVLNFGQEPRHEAFATDAFEYLEKMEEIYDLIILDPPAFAKHHNVLKQALQGYKRLNQKALAKIKPGGLLFTFSCSQVVSQINFRQSVFAAAANANRKVRVMHQLGHPVDHPVSIFHPEGEYLKGLVLHVE